MASLKQTSITGSLLVSGSSIIMPNLSASVDSGSGGQMWIDDSAGLELKFTQVGSYGSQNSPFTCLGAWSVGGNMINGRQSTSGAGTTADSAITAGGYVAPGYTTATEVYNGTSWASGGALSIARWTRLNGTQNAAMAAAGGSPTRYSCSEQYDGTSWSNGGAMNTARSDGGFTGDSGAGIYIGGQTPTLTNQTEIFNQGLGWSVGPNAPTVNFAGIAIGTNTATTFAVGNTSPSPPAYGASRDVLNFDGAAFSSITSLTNLHSAGAGYGQSSYAMGIVAGGSLSAAESNTEEWDGNAWNILPNLPIANNEMGGSGNVTTGNSVFGGPGGVSTTYEYNKSLLSPFTYDAAPKSNSWSVGASLITGARKPGGFGTQGAAVAAGGSNRVSPSESLTCTQLYNGSTWSAGGAMIQDRCSMAGGGTQPAGFIAGGSNTPTYYSNTEEYNGSAWANGGALITARSFNIGGGTQNAGLSMGGVTPSDSACIEEYNGTSWATAGALSIARYGGANNAGPSQTDGVIIGGYPVATAAGTAFEIWNGTSVSTGPNIAKCTANGGGGVTDSNNITISGGDPASPTSQVYNGTAWSFGAKTNQNMNSSASAGSGTAWGIFGGICAAPSATANVFLLYNTETNLCSTTPYKLGAWSNAALMITARGGVGGSGTQNAALAFGGYTPTITTLTEEYDGSSWTAGGALIIARAYMSTAGTQNAALGAGGYTPSILANTEEYNGTAWTAGGNLITGRNVFAGTGLQDAALAIGGLTPSTVACTEEYDGGTWSTGGALIIAIRSLGAAGTQNATVGFGGYTSSNTADTELYDGTSWSKGSSLNIARRNLRASGTQDAAIGFGGYTNSNQNSTEEFNGASWSIAENMITARYSLGADGTGTAAIGFGGACDPSTLQAATEKYTYGAFCVGAWSSASPLITARRAIGPSSLGSQNAALAGGGISPSVLSCTEEYNGSTWTAGGALITARSALNGTGTQNANLSVGGSGALTCTEEYDGTSWTAKTGMINGVYYMGLTGTTDAALKFSGYSNSYITCTEEWNGSSWATQNAVNNARTGLSGANGTQNATIWALGYGGSYTACHEHYDGTSWSAKAAVITSGEPGLAAIGTQNAYIASGLYGPAFSNVTNEWNGSAWNIGVSHPIKGNQGGSSGTTDSLITYGAQTPSALANAYNYDVTNPVNCGLYCLWNSLSYTTT